jgi:hypothetical protein
MNQTVRSDYLQTIFDPEHAARTLAWLKLQVEEHRSEFDAIAFRGTSGGPAFALGAMMGIPILNVRKDRGHSNRTVEGCWAGSNRIAIVDDFTQSGATVDVIMRQLGRAAEREYINPPPYLTRVFFYSLNGSWPTGLNSVLREHAKATVVARNHADEYTHPRLVVSREPEVKS